MRITIQTLCLFLILLGYFLSTLLYLGSSPPLSYDEAWHWSTAHSVASGNGLTTPVFGSFLAFDSFSFERMPVMAFVQAASISTFGSSVFSVRLPSVVFGALLVGLVFCFASRWLGTTFGVVAAASLALGQFCMVRPDIGVGIADVSRNARHDMALGFFSFLSIDRLAVAEKLGGRRRYAFAGMAMGLALLTHPVALLLPVVFLAWSVIDHPLRKRSRLIVPIGAFLVTFPYLVFLFRNWDIASKQLAYFNSGEAVGQGLDRFAFGARALIGNSAREWIRYDSMWRCLGAEVFPTITIGLVILGLALALITMTESFHARFLLTALFSITAGLAGFEAFKYESYLVMLVPLYALLMSYLLFLAWPRRTVFLILLAFAVGIPISSLSRLIEYRRVASHSSVSMDSLAQHLDESIPEGSTVVGSLRYWPFLKGRVFYDYQLPTARVRKLSFLDSTEGLESWFERVSPDYIILDSDWQRWAFEVQLQAYQDPTVRSNLEAVLGTYRRLSRRTIPGYGTLEILARDNPGER